MSEVKEQIRQEKIRRLQQRLLDSPPSEESSFKKALEGAVQGSAAMLNWPFEMLSTGVMGVADIPRRAMGMEPVISEEEALLAITPPPFRTSDQVRGVDLEEQYQQMGVPKELSGPLSFGTGLVFDPLNLVTMGGGQMVKQGAQKSLKFNPWLSEKVSKGVDYMTDLPGKTFREVGKSIYKSGVQKLDDLAKRRGKSDDAIPFLGESSGPAPSSVLIKYGASGGMDSLEKQAGTIASRLNSEADQILKRADVSGTTVDVTPVIDNAMEYLQDAKQAGVSGAQIQRAEAYLREKVADLVPMREVKEMRVVPSELFGPDGKRITNLKEVVVQKAVPPPTPSQVKARKVTVGQDMDASAFDPTTRDPWFLKFQKNVASNLKEAVEQAVEKSGVEGRTLYPQLNQEIGTLLSSQKALRNLADAERQRSVLSKSDVFVGLLGGAGTQSVEGTMAIMGAKKAFDVMSSPWMRTGVGNLMHTMGTPRPGRLQMGVRGSAEKILPRTYIELTRPEQEGK